MEEENKISKGIVAGCLVIVVALTIWVININDTLDTINTSITKINEDIISLDTRVKALEGGEING